MVNGQPMKRQELVEEFGYETFTKAVDNRLTRIDYVPPKGSLVTTRRAKRWSIANALGISIGVKAAFVTAHGIEYHPIDTIDKAWVK